MNICNLFLNRKGINPLIIVMVLFFLLIAVGGIIFIWSNLGERTGHVIQIQSVKFEETKTKIYVQNTGKGAVILALVIVDDETVEISKQNCLVSSYETTTVNETQTAEITINQNYGKKIRIKVVCVDGISYESDWSP